MIVTKKGRTLAEVIKKAIDDSVITTAKYEEITSIASEDGPRGALVCQAGSPDSPAGR